MKQYSKMELNSFLMKLSSGFDHETAQIVVKEFNALPPFNGGEVMQRTPEGDPMPTEFNFGRGMRVGSFRVEHVRFGENHVITWRRFEPKTEGAEYGQHEMPPDFELAYDKEGLEPTALTRIDYELDKRPAPLKWRIKVSFLWLFAIATGGDSTSYYHQWLPRETSLYKAA